MLCRRFPAGNRKLISSATDERILRYHEWVRENRARVVEASEGRVGYIHVGNVGGDGVEAFRREWRAQRLKVAAMIVDARSNSGGGQADDIVDWMARKPTRLMYDRRGRVPIWDYYLDGLTGRRREAALLPRDAGGTTPSAFIRGEFRPQAKIPVRTLFPLFSTRPC